MKKSTTTFCAVAALLASSQAFAHTGVRDQATEGTGSYNAFTLTHGCGNSGEGGAPAQSYPVLGQSAVVPHGANAVWRNKAGDVIQVGGNGNGAITAATLNLGLAGIEGTPLGDPQELVDGGVVQGLIWKDGVMQPNNYALMPFRVAVPTIVDNCVEKLNIRMGVINYCDIGKNAANDGKGPYEAPKDANGKRILRTTSESTGYVQANPSIADTFKDIKKGNGDDNRADWWFTAPHGGSTYYNDTQILQPTYWTTLTVNNKAADVAQCAGTKTEISVEPNGAAFDAILSPANTAPFSKGNGPL